MKLKIAKRLAIILCCTLLYQLATPSLLLVKAADTTDVIDTVDSVKTCDKLLKKIKDKASIKEIQNDIPDNEFYLIWTKISKKDVETFIKNCSKTERLEFSLISRANLFKLVLNERLAEKVDSTLIEDAVIFYNNIFSYIKEETFSKEEINRANKEALKILIIDEDKECKKESIKSVEDYETFLTKDSEIEKDLFLQSLEKLKNSTSEQDAKNVMKSILELSSVQLESSTPFVSTEPENDSVGHITYQLNGGTTSEELSNTFDNGIDFVLPSVDKTTSLNCSPHLSGIGWLNKVYPQGEVVGNPESNAIEAFYLESNMSGIKVNYRAYMQGTGWQEWKSKSEVAGLPGVSARILGYQITLEGIEADNYDVVYHAYTARDGWLPYTMNGGTAGYDVDSNGNYITGMQMKIIRKDLVQKAGYQFTGWYSDAECKDALSIIPAGTETIEVYAGWEKITYDIIYHLNGGTNNKDNPTTYDAGVGISTLKEPSKEGWKFGGWYTDQYLTKKYSGISDTALLEYHVYADWYDPQSYSISYELNGGENDARNPTNYTTGTEEMLYAPARSGYKFGGWYAEPEFTQKVDRIVSDTYGDIILYAKWDAIAGGQVYLTNKYTSNDADGISTLYMRVENATLAAGGIKVPTWTSTGGQDDIIWYGATKGEFLINGISYNYKCTINKGNHKNDYGPYWSHVYFYNSAGNSISSTKYEENYMLSAGVGYKVGDRGDNCTYWVCTNPLKEHSSGGRWSVEAYGKFYNIGATSCGVCARQGISSTLYVHQIEYYWTCSHNPNGVFVGNVIEGWCARNGGWAAWVGDTQYLNSKPNQSHNQYLCTDHRSGINYKIEYRPNGADGYMVPSNMTYGKSENLKKNTFTYNNRKFLGWSRDRDSEEPDYRDGESIQNLSTKDGDIINLYAVWGYDEIQITYNGNSADSGIVKTETITKEDCDKNNGYIVKTNKGYTDFKKKDNTLLGWSQNTTYNPDVVYKEGQSITYEELIKLSQSPKDMKVSGMPTVVFYAIWDEIPKINVPEEDALEFYEGVEVTKKDLLQGIVATDKEDGDITDNIRITTIRYAKGKLIDGKKQEETIVTFEKDAPDDFIFDTWFMQYDKKDNPVSHKVTYAITDSGGNEITYIRNIKVLYNEFPEIQAEDRYFTLDEAKEGIITKDVLLKDALESGKIKVTDKEDDMLYPDTISDKVELLNFNADEYKSFVDSGYITITASVYDSMGPDGNGKETFCQFKVHIVKDGYVVDPEKSKYPRFINERNYERNAHLAGTSLTDEEKETYNNNGGLNVDSKWYLETEFKNLLVSTWQSDSPKQIWEFPHSEVSSIKEYIETHGIGNSMETDALQGFNDRFGNLCEE